jgi:hypothetical protein
VQTGFELARLDALGVGPFVQLGQRHAFRLQLSRYP